MTVKELIEALQELDPELSVCFEWDNESLDIDYVIETFEYNKLEKIVGRKVILR